MTPKEINIELAKQEGWTQIHEYEGKTFGIVPDAEMMDSQGADNRYYEIPNYCEDLNAVQRVIEKMYTVGFSRLKLAGELEKVVKRPLWGCFDVTAMEKCKMILGCLKIETE